jgi:hypothetical protein
MLIIGSAEFALLNGVLRNAHRWRTRTNALISLTYDVGERSPAVGLSTLPLNSQDIGTSRWQLGGKLRRHHRPTTKTATYIGQSL